MARILVIGSANQDINLRVVRFPSPGETVIALDRWSVLGGKGANQAMAAARLGADVALIARVGRDYAGNVMMSSLQDAGINIEGVETDPDRPTGTADILVDAAGENTIVADPGANRGLDTAQIDRHESLFQQAEICVLQCEIPLETVAYAVRMGKKHHVRILLNPSPAVPLDSRTLSGIEYLVPNEHELVRLHAGKEPADGAWTPERLRQLAERSVLDGAENVLVTLGAEGCILIHAGGMRRYPARKVESVDTTGAGDTFLGAFAAALTARMEVDRAIRYAAAAASITVSRQGTWAAMPDAAEMRAAFDGQQAMWYDQ